MSIMSSALRRSRAAAAAAITLLLFCVRGPFVAGAVPAVPHDYQLCVTWGVEGGGLPDSSVTRCLNAFDVRGCAGERALP